MAHSHKVLKSLESPCGLRCVDIIAHPDAKVGWASFRRDPEDGHGWRPDGYSASGFASSTAAEQDARKTILWMETL